jgi:hypothetical protein
LLVFYTYFLVFYYKTVYTSFVQFSIEIYWRKVLFCNLLVRIQSLGCIIISQYMLKKGLQWQIIYYHHSIGQDIDLPKDLHLIYKKWPLKQPFTWVFMLQMCFFLEEWHAWRIKMIFYMLLGDQTFCKMAQKIITLFSLKLSAGHKTGIYQYPNEKKKFLDT